MDLIKLSFVECDELPDQVIRPLETTLKKSHIDLFADATDGGARISNVRLAKVTAPLFGPSSRRKLDANIDGGWANKRIMFAMVVRTANRDMSEEYNYIVGYTDHAGYSALDSRRVKFDKNMRLYFNNVTKVHMTEAMYRGRQKVWQPKIQAHDQILLRKSIIGFDRDSSRSGERPVTLRPSDLLRRAGADSAFGSYLKDKDLPTSNLSGAFNGMLRASTRQNNSPTNFLTRHLNAWTGASANPSSAFVDDEDHEDTIAAAQDRVTESALEQEAFFEKLKAQTNIFRQGYITYGELLDMNPDFNEDTQLPFKPLPRKADRKRSTQNVASQKSDDVETIAAFMIKNSLPGILIQSMYSQVQGLVINTRARVNEPKVLASKLFPFADGMSVEAGWAYFEDQIEHVLMEEVSKNGQFDVEAHIDCNIDQFIQMYITIDGGEESYHEFPLFSDSTAAPTQDSGMDALENLSKRMVNLSSAISQTRAHKHPAHLDKPGIALSSDVSAAREDRDRRRDDRDRERSSTPKKW